MILILHISIALLSLVLAAVVAARPSMKLVKIVSGTIIATLASGTALIFQGASLWHLCLSGLVFTMLTVGAVVVALRRMKLAEHALAVD